MPNNRGMEQITPIEKVINLLGGVTACARLVGVSPPTVHEWKTHKRKVPVERCQQLEELVNREVTCEEMRPEKVAYFAYMRHRPAPESLKDA
jgi:DNA-binding transcriptional regulator YdaS (Cro superfamily)